MAWLGTRGAVVSGDAFIYRHTLNAKFVSYFLQSKDFQRQKIRHVTGAKVRRISGTSLAKIRIPVPPLEVQQEIVRILDKFTDLEAELEARRKQLEHYRAEIMTFSTNVPMVRLAEVVEVRSGWGFPKKF